MIGVIKKNLIQYKLWNFYVRLGRIVEKVHEIISFRQSKWLEKDRSFNTQKRNKAKNISRKTSTKCSKLLPSENDKNYS